ncbi:ATP-binding cassette domain-containing protein [Solicola gregarius]|uniref:ATP-binding cassette domain-containing protein n=1 Tax=Solicola gregarius TaxID=2908642 RepID=A0AA46YIZ8_9ACTN|nr:ATP-binding cassette domain-containing protein [Solicola gregarius]UYM03627.1 ATP-binding cassette domain-containing protein [Solicola gregarius]
MANAIELNGLHKRYGDQTALDGLDLAVPEGSVAGLLGANGAGKTTAVRILSTLLRPDSGTAQVCQADVVEHPQTVRASLGLTGQFAAVDEILTGAENLRMIGRLFRLSRADATQRADDLLAAFELADAADRQVKTYSGGMRRRLDLAASLIARPRVLVLDEPTTGLDPRSRLTVWDAIARLRNAGTTVLLTTQDLEEAEHLADEIAVMASGRLIAHGTADQLKSEVGGENLCVQLPDAENLQLATDALRDLGNASPVVDAEAHVVTVALDGSGIDGLADAVIELRRRDITIKDVEVRRPTLDDVFLRLTSAYVAPGDTNDDSGWHNRQHPPGDGPYESVGPAAGSGVNNSRRNA